MWHLNLPSINQTLHRIGLQQFVDRAPPAVIDRRFKKTEGRWAYCDQCHRRGRKTYCQGNFRGEMDGSFVFRADNQIAGPTAARAGAFPLGEQQHALSKTGRWNATYACRNCLPELWAQPPEACDKWLGFVRPDQAQRRANPAARTCDDRNTRRRTG